MATNEYHYVITVQCSNQTGGLNVWTRSGTYIAQPSSTEGAAFGKILSSVAEENRVPPERLSVLFYRLVPLALGSEAQDG